MLDARLALAAELYQPCSTGADVGTDHGLLPCHLLEQGVCEQMILTDVSPKALARARTEVCKRHLESRTHLVCGDGLEALDAPCGCISITGMGGRTIAGILHRGQEKLRGAALVLCAHTEQPEARQALQEIGYRLQREEPCLCNGHAYLVWLAVPGEMQLQPMEMLCGRELFYSKSPMLQPYLQHRLDALQRRLDGLARASRQDHEAITRTRAVMDYYLQKAEESIP